MVINNSYRNFDPKLTDVIKESEIFNDTIPPMKLTFYNPTLYHTTNTLPIQSNQKLEWFNKKFPLLKVVLKYKSSYKTTMVNTYNKYSNYPQKTIKRKQSILKEK